MKNTEQKQTGSESGAIIVEATISLSTFMFAMYILLSVIQMAYVQERMAVALDRTSKEMAEFKHVWFATGMAGIYSGKGGKSSNYANESAEMLKKIGSVVHSDMVTNAGNALEGDSLTAIAEKGVGIALAEGRFKQNVVPDTNGKTGDFDGFLKRNRIENYSLGKSVFFQEEVFLRVDYDMKVVPLLNIDIRFHMSHCSYARAWAGGKE